MKKECSSKILDIIKKSKRAVCFLKDDRRSLAFEYNKKTGAFGAIYRSKRDSELKKSHMNRLDVLRLIHETDFDQEADAYCEEMMKREQDYSRLKTSLLTQLDREDFPAQEKANMRNVIELLTQVPQYATVSPTIELERKVDGEYTMRKYLRVGNEYDRTQRIGVQLIKRETYSTGSETGYTRIGLHRLAGIIRDNNIIVDPLKEEESRLIDD